MNCDYAQMCELDVADLGTLDQIPPGQGRCFIAGQQQVAVFRLRDGRVFALDNRCPHRGGPLSEGLVGTDFVSRTEAVVCPYHAYKFSLRDGRSLDTELQVRSYQTEVRDGRIYLSVASPG